jgi:hypothetical protein
MKTAPDPTVQFIRNPYRKEWAIHRGGHCIGHIWYWPLGQLYCLRIGNDSQATYHAICGKTRQAAKDQLAPAHIEPASIPICTELERRGA